MGKILVEAILLTETKEYFVKFNYMKQYPKSLMKRYLKPARFSHINWIYWFDIVNSFSSEFIIKNGMMFAQPEQHVQACYILNSYFLLKSSIHEDMAIKLPVLWI